jgi:hypothetical protein
MDPGTLIPDIGHFEKVFIQSGFTQTFLKKGLMGPGGTGSHNSPIKPLFPDDLLHRFLTVGGTGEEVVIGMGHSGQGAGIFRGCIYIHHPGNIDPAMTDKDPDLVFFLIHFPFRGKGHVPYLGAPHLG